MFQQILIISGAGKPCTTPMGQPGQCIEIHQCEFLFNIILKVPVSAENENLIKQSQCDNQDGVDYTVCCPNSSDNKTLGTNCSMTADLLSMIDSCSLLPTNCGTSRVVSNIFRGNKTTLGEFPWLALLEYTNGRFSS